ncbi:MAG: succinate dehydrogenase, hydrophobic rane anchor protein [Pseudomonadota bacterium]|jgi:succinate dehydrogenase / fumarate reductase membrane anchor subunit
MAKNNIGPKRLVVGASYGLRDWLAQRITAVIMALYTVILLVTFLLSKENTYMAWGGLFAQQWFKLASLVTAIALYYHVWVGVRDIWMDYVKPVSVRLVLQAATIVWLVGCTGYTVQILWSV